MKLIFNTEEILERGRALTFEDVLLVPQHSQISSRCDPLLETKLTKKRTLSIPLVSANMDTITEWEMACAMAEQGGLGILHRFMSVEEQVEMIKKIQHHHREKGLKAPLAASVGVKKEGQKRADLLVEAGVDLLTLDIAHGDSMMMLEMLSYIKKHHPHIEVIAGNVATAQGTRRLIEAGADAIKCGIGPGSMCTTRIITGHGVAQLSAIALCAQEAHRHEVPVIADGGIKNSGDMVKALCGGAQSIMAGGLLAGTLETPGEVRGGKKLYRGMASKSAQDSWRGGVPKGMAAEGEATMISCKGSVFKVVEELMGGVRSGMTYLGANKIEEMFQKAHFMEISAAGMSESCPHGVI